MIYEETSERLNKSIDERGYYLLEDVYTSPEVHRAIQSLTKAMHSPEARKHLVVNQDGHVTGARNVTSFWPEAGAIWQRPAIVKSLAEILGSSFGLVRMLYFNKPPGRSWALPWHKDLTIAVHDNRLPSSLFCKPTKKAGVPHVEAPEEVLERMLTARIHLDAVNDENGALQVIPGSHRTGKSLELTGQAPETIFCQAGDVLLIRPLVAHCSIGSAAHCKLHRRILHMEFAADEILPDGYVWSMFLPPPSTN